MSDTNTGLNAGAVTGTAGLSLVPAFVAFSVAILCACASEGLVWYIIYRHADYKKLCFEFEDQQAKLDANNTTSGNNLSAGGYGQQVQGADPSQSVFANGSLDPSKYTDLTFVLTAIFLINVSLIAKDKSCIGSLSFSVVRASDLNPVSDKKTKF